MKHIRTLILATVMLISLNMNAIPMFNSTTGSTSAECGTATDEKPRIRIIATDGTIAGSGESAVTSGYAAGQVGVQALMDAVPQIHDIALVSGEQLVNIGSQDMTDQVWLQLAKRINQLLCEEEYDGVLVTHGTDTMEETAYFLSLTVRSDKPVVLVGAMRPSTAMSADGPANLYNGIVTAASHESKGHGVMVCMNNQIFDAKSVTKTHTTDVAAFTGVYGQIGYVYNSKAYYVFEPKYRHTTNSEFRIEDLNELPEVDIIYGYSNASDAAFKALISSKVDGIILAGVGDGNFHTNVFGSAVKAQNKGIQIVRSSRVPYGPTCENGEVDDSKHHFVAAIDHNPQKARVLLMLALTKTRDWQRIQQYFYEY